MSANYKNFPFHLIGCTLFLFVGARTQSVKAILPDPSVVEMHWQKNPKIFHETFEVLFPKAEWLPFWGEDFPDWFKNQNGNLCTVKTGSDDLSFHTLDDLEKLKCDAELKKIIKVLGSTEFLEKVLPKEVVKSIFAHATGGEEFRLEIIFRPHFKDAFFNPLGKGSLDMTICLKYFSEEAMRCSFIFDFEKENNITVLKNCNVSYRTDAVLPEPSVVEMHWRKNPKIFHETFEVLFPKAEWLPFWGEDFPDWFKNQNGNLCTVKTGSDDLSFHTLDDLEKLKCDAELKKIIKVLGSTEFLEKVLPKEVVRSIFAHATGGEEFRSGEVVKSIFAHATGGEEFRLEIVFRPLFKNAFFNPLDKGSLDMTISLEYFSKEAMRCSFIFDFEKENNITVLKNCRVSYRTDDTYSAMQFFKKTNKLPDFPWDAVREAKKNFSSVYAKLRDDLETGRKKYEDCKICSIAKDALDDFLSFRKDFYEQEPYYVNAFSAKAQKRIKEEARGRWRLECLYHVSSLLNIIITEDFLNGIFGEKFWNIFENGDTLCGGYSSTAHFEISEYTGGLKVSFLLENIHRGNMTEDVVSFDSDGKGNWEWLDSNYINFVFLYDPSKDKTSHVRLCDKLVLNHEIIQKGDTKNTLLPIGSEDFCRSNSFWLEVNAPSFLKYYRRLPKTGKLIEVIENDILKTLNCFNKDEKGFIEILSRWAAPRIFLKMTKSLPLLKKGDITASSEEEQESSRDAKRLEKNPLLDEPE